MAPPFTKETAAFNARKAHEARRRNKLAKIEAEEQARQFAAQNPHLHPAIENPRLVRVQREIARLSEILDGDCTALDRTRHIQSLDRLIRLERNMTMQPNPAPIKVELKRQGFFTAAPKVVDVAMLPRHEQG